MMQKTFLRRLVYYLVGFGFGLILVFFVFGNRGCSWLPKNKVKESISKRFVVSNLTTVNSSNFKDLIENAEIDFDNSDKNTPNKTYFVKLSNHPSNIQSFFVSYNADSYLAVVHENKNDLKKFQTDTFLRIIHVPQKESALINFDVTTELKNKLVKLKIGEETYEQTFKHKGYIQYNYLKPNNELATFLLKEKNSSARIIYKWKDLTLLPTSIE
jgi:hypothetical protein